jgi:RND family efflux transporter MFP subunit
MKIRVRTIAPPIVAVCLTAALAAKGVDTLLRAEREKAGVGDAASPENAPTPISAAKAQVRPISVTVSSRGFLLPYQQIQLSAEVSGPIRRQWVDVADTVSKDYPLFEIERASFKAAVDRAKAIVKQAESRLALAEENRETVRKMDQAAAAGVLETAEAELEYQRAEAVLSEAEAGWDEAQIALDKTEVRAPIDGIVAAIHRKRGEFAHVGRPLIDLIEVSRLKLKVELSGREVDVFQHGGRAEISVEALPGRDFEGRIALIHPQARPDSKRFVVEIEIPNPDGKLRPDFFATATLKPKERASKPSALVIPLVSVFDVNGEHYCFVVRRTDTDLQDHASLTPIEFASILSDREHVQVTRGLSPGDVVATRGIQHLSDGCAVLVVE